MKPSRAVFLKHLLALTGTPYIWAGRTEAGVDCSGAVTLALYTASGGNIDARKGWWTDRFWTELEAADSPKPGDLCLYGGTGLDVQHVTVLLFPERTPGVRDGMVVGACGGNSDFTTAAIAKQHGACVMAKASIHYRNDFRGYRSMRAFLREEP